MAYKMTILKGGLPAFDLPGSGSILPGTILERFENSSVETVRASTKLGKRQALLVARDNPEGGKGITDAYASGQRVMCVGLRPFDRFVAILAAGVNYAKHAELQVVSGGKVGAIALTALTGTLTGTANGALVDVAATPGACAGNAEPSAANVDTAIATAVGSIVSGVNEQNKELMTAINSLIAQNNGAVVRLCEACDLSGEGAVDTLVEVEVI